MSLINKNYGIVKWVATDRNRIKIRLPRGGDVEARNEGFEVGDVVAFTLNLTGTQVIKVMPKYVADIIVEISRNKMLQSALQEEVFNEHNTETEGIEEDSPDCRPTAEECPDLYGRECREDAKRWQDNYEYSTEVYPSPWPFS